MNKAKLIETLRASRAEFEAALAPIAPARLSEPNTLDAWAIKDHIAHLAHYEGWYADRLDEALHGVSYHPGELDFMPFEERNQVVYQAHRNQPLDEVLAESGAAHEKLMKGVQAQAEDFLITPQQFEGAPGPSLVWEMLRGDVYEHYIEHAGWIKSWWAAQVAEQKGEAAPRRPMHQNMEM